MKRKSKAIRKGIKNIGKMLETARNNNVRNLLYKYNPYITLDILDARDRTGLAHPVNIGEEITIDTISFICFEILNS